MTIVLGVNHVFHDPSAALVVDGTIVAAAEEERFSRRKHGRPDASPFYAWETPREAIQLCLRKAGITADEVDVVATGYNPALLPAIHVHDDTLDLLMRDGWELLRTLYATRSSNLLEAAVPGLGVKPIVHVDHHVAHAASAYLASGFSSSAVFAADGRGEVHSHLSGVYDSQDGPGLRELSRTRLPNSLGLIYEELTAHLGWHRSSDEYKVMGLASYGKPRFADEIRAYLKLNETGRDFIAPIGTIPWSEFCPPVRGTGWGEDARDLAASVQAVLEEVLVEHMLWLAEATGETRLAMAGGVALNCVANSRVWRETPFKEIFVQPAAGDAGCSLGAALTVASRTDPVKPFETAALGSSWSDNEIEATLRAAKVVFNRAANVPEAVAHALSRNEIVAWFQGASEFGPRALGYHSLLAHPGYKGNLERLNNVKGREHFRPVAPMVLEEQAPVLFDEASGPLPSPYMLFTHQVRPAWRQRLVTVTHVDNSARVQTVSRRDNARVYDMLTKFAQLTGTPACVNTSLNTAGRPMVDSPRDALELFGSSPVDLLAVGNFLVRR